MDGGRKRARGSPRCQTWDGQLFADPAVLAFLDDAANRVVFTTWRERMERYKE